MSLVTGDPDSATGFGEGKSCIGDPDSATGFGEGKSCICGACSAVWTIAGYWS